MKNSIYSLRFLLICLFGVLMGNHVYAKKQIEPLDNPMEHKLPLKVSMENFCWSDEFLINDAKSNENIKDYIKRSVEKNCIDSVNQSLGTIEVVCLLDGRITAHAFSMQFATQYELIFYILDKNKNIVYTYNSPKCSLSNSEYRIKYKQMVKFVNETMTLFVQNVNGQYEQIHNDLQQPKKSNFALIKIGVIDANSNDPKSAYFVEIDGLYKGKISNYGSSEVKLPVGVHMIKIYPNRTTTAVHNKKCEYRYFNTIQEAKDVMKFVRNQPYNWWYAQTIGKTICAVSNENYLTYSYVYSPGFWDYSYGTLLLTSQEEFLSSFNMHKMNENSNMMERRDEEQLLTDDNSHNFKNPIASQTPLSDVDVNISQSTGKSRDTYVLIISNEQYEYLDKVNYAAHDGEIFKEYCTKTLGIPEKQIFYYTNATFGKITDGVEKLKYCLNNFENSKAIVYYCGHGIPDEKTGQAYLIPVDGKGTNMTTCYSLKNLYKTLAATKAQSITYFMDACFTGANKEGSMLVAARGVAREPVKETLAGKTVVFSASSGDETAMTLEEQGHGLFTYYLLKKLQETEGNVTYGELADYINKNVKKDAFLINEKPQTPVVATSPAVQNTWKTMKLK